MLAITSVIVDYTFKNNVSNFVYSTGGAPQTSLGPG